MYTPVSHSAHLTAQLPGSHEEQSLSGSKREGDNRPGFRAGKHEIPPCSARLFQAPPCHFPAYTKRPVRFDRAFGGVCLQSLGDILVATRIGNPAEMGDGEEKSAVLDTLYRMHDPWSQ